VDLSKLSRKDFLDSVKGSMGIASNASSMDLFLCWKSKPVITIHLADLLPLAEELVSFYRKKIPVIKDENGTVVREDVVNGNLKQMMNLFAELKSKHVPGYKLVYKQGFSSKDTQSFMDLMVIVKQLSEAYPDRGVTATRYVNTQFVFYRENFGTVPKIQHFITENAILRFKKVLDHTDTWPSDKEIEALTKYGAFNKEKMSLRESHRIDAEKKEKESREKSLFYDKFSGNRIFLTQDDKDTYLSDNSKFVECKNRVIERDASIYEVQYVIDCYTARDSVGQIPSSVLDYKRDLLNWARQNGIKVRL